MKRLVLVLAVTGMLGMVAAPALAAPHGSGSRHGSAYRGGHGHGGGHGHHGGSHGQHGHGRRYVPSYPVYRPCYNPYPVYYGHGIGVQTPGFSFYFAR